MEIVPVRSENGVANQLRRDTSLLRPAVLYSGGYSDFKDTHG